MDLRTTQQRIKEEFEASTIASDFKNVVILDDFSHIEVDLINQLFNNEEFILMPRNSDMFDVLCACGCFKSKTNARQNWTKTDKEIEFGFSSFIIGRKNFSLTIFKPVLDI